MSTVAKLDGELKVAGIPIVGVSRSREGVTRVDFAPEATAQHRIDAQAIVDAFDWSPVKPRDDAAILADVKPAVREAILTAMILDWLKLDPIRSRRIGVEVEEKA